MILINFIKGGKGSIKSFVKNRKLDIGFILAGLFIGVFFGWNALEISFFLIFIWSIIGPIQSRYLAWLAIFFLSLTALLLVFGEKEWAEEFSIFVYYLLVMVVVRGIIEMKNDEN